MKFDDFEEPKLSPDAFKTEDTGRQINLPRTTTSQLAANEVIREGGSDGSVDLFRRIRETLHTPEGQARLKQNSERDRSMVEQETRDNMGSILLDPSLTDESKSAFLEGFKNFGDNYKPRPMDRMVEEAIAAQSREDESEEEHESRLNTIDLISEVNEVKRSAAAALNAHHATKDPTLGTMAVDLAELFVPLVEWGSISRMQDSLNAGDAVLMGDQKRNIIESLKNTPYDKRADMTERLIDFVDQHGQVVLPDGNDLLSMDVLQQMLVSQDYGDTERWADNIFGVLDIAGVFGTAATLFKGASKAARGAEAASEASETARQAEAARVATKTEVKPTSPKEVIKDANPEQARIMQKTIEDADGDEAAEALAGTTKEEAVAEARLPEVEAPDGSVKNKTTQWGPDNPEPEDIREIRRASGNSQVTSKEMETVEANVVRSLERVDGMRLHKESMQIGRTDAGQLRVTGMYRPKDSGFKTARKAVDNALFAFRNYGLREEDLTLYRRGVKGWEPTTQKELTARAELREGYTRSKKKIPADLKEIDYAVGIKYDYEFSPEDVSSYEVLDTGRFFGIPLNLTDRATPGISKLGQGSLTQNLLDASSVLHPQIVEPAYAAIDRGAGLKQKYIDQFYDFTQKYNKMGTERKARMTNYIHEANDKGIKLNVSDLAARGFDDEEIEMLRQWRKANDTMWWAANGDMVKSMRNRGYQMYKHGEETTLLVKPMKRSNVGPKTEYLDPSDGSIKKAREASELDDFYGRGGTYARLSEPVEYGGQWVDVVKVDETLEGGYMRRLRDDDIILNYREGYYPVKYDANFFIEKQITKAGGEKFTKVVGSAKTREEAEHMLKNLRDEDPEAVVDFREDRRSDEMKAQEFDESSWSLGVSSGMSNQRIRGERLKSSEADLTGMGNAHLMDPMNAVAEQIQQVSARVSTRNYLDTVKRRFINNYADKLRLEKNRDGSYDFPSSITQIMGKGETDAQTLADARTLFNYINTLENGYVNGIDAGVRMGLNYGANLFEKVFGGGKASGKVRDMTKNGNLSGGLKGLAFNLYLAANPARQLLIQAHQNIQLVPLNPSYVIGGGMTMDWWKVRAARRGLTDDPESIKMYEELKRSGHLDAVEANNLIREDRLRLADDNLMQKAKRIGTKPLNISRKYGFDEGENAVLLFSWLAHYDKAKKAKKGKLTARDYEEIAGKSRSYTYGMNRAGDMPYNKNSLSIITQFLQVPHKAILQQFTNRSLTPAERVKLGTWNTVVYGVPPVALGSWFHSKFEDSPQKEVIQHGLEHVLLNAVATQISGEEQQIDWSDLSPVELQGMADLYAGMLTSNIGEMIAQSPSGSLFFGNNPRITNSVKSAMRYFHGGFDYEDPELDTKLSDVAIAAGELFSGFSSAWKARYAFKTGQKMSSSGRTSDDDVTKFEAMMQAFGFKTMTETGTWAVNEEMFGENSFEETDVQKWYGELKRHLARRNVSVREEDMAQKIFAEGWVVFQDDPHKFRSSLMNAISKDMKENNFNVFERIMQKVGQKTPSELLEILDNMPDSEGKRAVREALKGMEIDNG